MLKSILNCKAFAAQLQCVKEIENSGVECSKTGEQMNNVHDNDAESVGQDNCKKRRLDDFSTLL
jgi:hypothetical protein